MIVLKAISKLSIGMAVVVWMISCGTVKSKPIPTEVVTIGESPKIAFLSYEFKKGVNDRLEIKLIDQILREGKLKREQEEGTFKTGDYELIQLDGNDQSLTVKRFKNPLTQIIEYVNDDGTFGKKEVLFDRKEISIRIQLDAQTKSVLLHEIGNESVNFIKTKI